MKRMLASVRWTGGVTIGEVGAADGATIPRAAMEKHGEAGWRLTVTFMLKLKREKKFGGITVAGAKQKEEKNRGTQLIFILAMLVTGFGGVLSYGGSIVGFIIFIVGLLSLIGVFIWALKNWNY